MSTTHIGKVRTGSGVILDVNWNDETGTVSVSVDGWTEIGTAKTPSEAMLLADEWLSDK